LRQKNDLFKEFEEHPDIWDKGDFLAISAMCWPGVGGRFCLARVLKDSVNLTQSQAWWAWWWALLVVAPTPHVASIERPVISETASIESLP
jgi:hypothetical protein